MSETSSTENLQLELQFEQEVDETKPLSTCEHDASNSGTSNIYHLESFITRLEDKKIAKRDDLLQYKVSKLLSM